MINFSKLTLSTVISKREVFAIYFNIYQIH